MSNITTEAWVLYRGRQSSNSEPTEPAELKRESFSFPEITDEEVLAEPIYGCWEGNMTHAVERRPVDICQTRGEERVVIGNAGVVRVAKTGRLVKDLKEGDICLFTGAYIRDRRGFMLKASGYDAPHSPGLLAKQTKIPADVLIPIREDTNYSLQQWAAFSVRYVTAWANWKKAYGCYRALLDEEENPAPFVWGWGGGVALAELELAKFYGCQVAMVASKDKRLDIIKQRGIRPIDRRQFADLNFDERRFKSDPAFKAAYQMAEDKFLQIVQEFTLGEGVSIFMDYIGSPVMRATLKALARPGVVTTAGWKMGMKISLMRAIECMNWHAHVHTHYARYKDAVEAMDFAEQTGWLPNIDEEVCAWDNIPQLAENHLNEKIDSYFPIYRVN
jgi:NADPH:quinone reductase-like Zn-dependent oxidoreductase